MHWEGLSNSKIYHKSNLLEQDLHISARGKMPRLQLAA